MSRSAVAWHEPDEDEARDSFAEASWDEVFNGTLQSVTRAWDPELDYWDRLERSQKLRLAGKIKTIRTSREKLTRDGGYLGLAPSARMRARRAEFEIYRNRLRVDAMAACRAHAVDSPRTTSEIASLMGCDSQDAGIVAGVLFEHADAGRVDWFGSRYFQHPLRIRWQVPGGESRVAREVREAREAEGERLRDAHRRTTDALAKAQRAADRAAAKLAAWEARHG